jgi:hypothetical protein
LSSSITEKRKQPRFNYDKRTRCKFLGDKGTKLDVSSYFDFRIQILDISTGGARISCDGSAKPLIAQTGNLVEIRIPFEGKHLTITGKIVWYERTDSDVKAGISFNVLIEQDNNKLIRYLQKELKIKLDQ